MRERAANRAAIARLAMSDMIESCMHQRQAARDEVGKLKFALAQLERGGVGVGLHGFG